MRPEDKDTAASVTPSTPQQQQLMRAVVGRETQNVQPPLRCFPWETDREQHLQELAGTVDHLKNLLVQEETYYVPCMDYLAVIGAAASCKSGGDRVSESWRRKLCEWCFEVVDHFGMEREVVSIAMSYLDRIVAKTLQVQGRDHPISKREFQLLAVVSLYIAVKLHGETDDIDMDRRRLNVDVFVELSRGFFQAEAIEAMEVQILFHLNWHLNPPTPLKFISSLMGLIPAWNASELEDPSSHNHQQLMMVGPPPAFRAVFKAIFDVSMYLTELSVCVSTFTFHSKNSVVAFASILCAMEALEDTLPVPYRARVQFVNHVAAATGLLPGSEEVRCVRDLLKELCPAIEERDVASLIMMGDGEEDDAGKASPICVSYGIPQELLSGRKHW